MLESLAISEVRFNPATGDVGILLQCKRLAKANDERVGFGIELSQERIG